MKGGIYPRYLRRRGVVVRNQDGKKVQSGWRVVFGSINKNFALFEHTKEPHRDLTPAERFLNGLRYESDRGTFDVRDYRSALPLGFENLTEKFLKANKHLKSVNKYRQRLRFGVQAWGNRNIKTIGYGDLEDLKNELLDAGKSPYYIKHILNAMSTFWHWLAKRKEITADQVPEFPEIDAEPELRKIVTKDKQAEIISRIFEDTWEFNPRIYIAVSILATYPSVRPGELIQCKEKYFDPDMGRLYITDPKERRPKYIPLVEYHVGLLTDLGRSFPEMPLFRHRKGNGAAKPGDPFSRGYLYEIWKRACKKVGVDGVSLYPGTKHSTVVGWRNELGISKSHCKEGTGHKTNKAFERYYELQDETLRSLYRDGMGEVVKLKDGKKTKV